MAQELALSAISRFPVSVTYRRTGDILSAIAGAYDHRWTLRDLAAALDNRSIGFMLLIFALPNALPIPIVSVVTSVPLIFCASQLLVGRNVLWLPEKLSRRSIAGDGLKPILLKAIPWLIRLERVFKPRQAALSGAYAERLTGGLILLLGCLVALPIPLGNVPLGIAMTVMALALVERDGRVMLLGWLFTLISLIFFWFLIAGYKWAIWQAVDRLL